jgi:PAS domain S-box-containing protein
MVMESLDAATWKLVLDAIPEAISVHSTDAVILHANRGLAELYAMELRELIGRSCEEVFHKEGWVCPHEEVLLSGRRVECKLDYGEKSFRVSFNPVLGEGGQIRGYLRVARDVSEEARVRERLLSAETFATLGQMAAGIAHTVGNLLNVISGYSEYLLMKTGPDEAGYKELTTILQQTRRVADFVKHMLELTRPPGGPKCAIGLKGFLSEVVDLMEHQLRKKGVKVSVVCTGKPPLVYGDAPGLKRAFFSLFLSAIEGCNTGKELEVVLEEAVGRPGYIKVVLKGIEQVATGEGIWLAKEAFSDFGGELSLCEQDRGRAVVVFLPVGELS